MVGCKGVETRGARVGGYIGGIDQGGKGGWMQRWLRPGVQGGGEAKVIEARGARVDGCVGYVSSCVRYAVYKVLSRH